MSKRELLRDSPERRSIALSDFDVTRSGDTLSLDGYASVFGHEYPVRSGPPRGWIESVDKRAFDVTLAAKPDLHLLINHEGMPLARTKSGTLQLSTDTKGLRVQAPNLDRRDPDVQRLEVKMQRGDMDEMSFAFRVKRDDWSPDESRRHLLEVSLHKGDVSVVNFGASDATHAQMNSLSDALGFLTALDDAAALAELRSITDPAAQLSVARAKLAQLEATLRPRGSGRLTLADALRVQAGLMDLDVRAQMSGQSMNDLPDSAFAYIEPGGKKDSSGKTVPRSLRHFPIHDAAHVRNALARAPQSPFGKQAMPKILAAAKKFGIAVSSDGDSN